MPIYVTYNSMDVWCHPQLFKLDQDKEQTYKAGVPPDYFSKTGQLWGNPVYQWKEHHKEKYTWWIQRIKQHLQMVDLLRKNSHSRSLGNGSHRRFFRSYHQSIPHRSLYCRRFEWYYRRCQSKNKKMALPRNAVLIFAFGDDFSRSIHLPHHYAPNYLVYSGTHYNNTIQGWQSEEWK